MSQPDSLLEPAELGALPRLPRDMGGPVFAEPWQAQAFALAVRLSQQGFFTWKEWAAALAAELQGALDRGEPDDGSRYYEHWLAALERLVTAKGLASPSALRQRKDAWAVAYENTPHGIPVELKSAYDARWLLLGLAGSLSAWWIIQHARVAFVGELPHTSLLAGSSFGTLLGMRHALEPDHLAAVSTLLTGERSSAKAAWLGACWGLGHTLTLLVAGALLVVLNGQMPAVLSEAFEICVVLMLAGFGLRAIYYSASARPRVPSHVHATTRLGGRGSWGRLRLARRPLLVGAVHGLAGSGVLTALVVTAFPSMVTRLAYLAMFGVGSTAGMAILSGVLGWPLARLGGHALVGRGLSLVIGCLSTGLGLSWAYVMLSRAP